MQESDHKPTIEEQWRRKLLDEGFEDVYIWRDAPNASYSDHAHPFTSAHVILEGEMTIVSEHQGRVLRVGDRMDVLAGTIHSVKMGNSGCRYIIGQKYGI
jgi:quercetin dioxygenase-like cupin family protein